MGLKPLREAIKETREHLEIDGNPDATEEDALEDLIGECVQMPDGSCTMAGSEYCDFECPFN